VAIPASDLDPAAGFDRDWAQALVNGALEQLGREFAEAGKVERWRVLKRFLWENGDATSYDESGCSLGLSRHGVRVAVHRMRRRFAELVRREVAETLADPTWEAVEEEIGDLLKALGRSAWASGKNSV
jgi:RNA polymerase sigma-70 factor (ECF subfamily)